MLVEAQVRLEELLRDVVQRPEVAGDLADELTETFYVLRNYAYFVDFQRKELDDLCQEMDRL
jgi:hypothetical protein